MYCTSCGARVADGSAFCPKCGAALREAGSEGAGAESPGPEAAAAQAPSSRAGSQRPDGAEERAAHAPSVKKKSARVAVIAAVAVVVVIAAVVGGMALLKVGPFAPAVAIDLAQIPDGPWKAYLQDNVDTDRDGVVSEEEAWAVTQIGTAGDGDAQGNGLNGLGVDGLPGIDRFANLTTLVCSDNQIPELDLSKNTSLGYLACDDNGMTALTLPAGDALATVHATGNDLEEVDLSQAAGLTDAKFDAGVELVGNAFDDAAAQKAISDMAVLYFTASGVPENAKKGTDVLRTPGENGSLDSYLISNMAYSEPNRNIEGLGQPNETYGFGIEGDLRSGLCSASDEAVRAVLVSFYGSAPDSLDYLAGNGHMLRKGESWDLSVGSMAATNKITVENWKQYGHIVAFDASIEEASEAGTETDAFHITAVQDENSKFGYHLSSFTVESSKFKEPVKSHISTKWYELDIPRQWVGEVDYTTEGDRTTIYLAGNKELKLCSIDACSPEEEQMGGDIGYGNVGQKTSGNGKNVVSVWVWNWTWEAAMDALGNGGSSAFEGCSASEKESLVNLSTGGAVSYDDVVADPDSYMNYTGHYDFAESAILDKLTAKNATPLS